MIRAFGSRKAAPWLFLAPVLLLGALLYLLPITASFGLSFADWNALSPPRWAGLRNYIYLLTEDPLFGGTVLNTLIFAVGSTLVGLPVALALALALVGARGKAVWRSIYWLPTITNVVAVAYVWQVVLDPAYGVVNRLLAGIGVAGPDWLSEPSFAMVSLVAVMVWMSIGHNVLLFTAGLDAIDPALRDAARTDGATRWQVFRHVTWPLLQPTVAFVSITSLIAGAGSFALVLVLTEGGPDETTEVTALYMYRMAFQNLRLGRASAVAFLLMAAIVFLAILQFRLVRGDGAEPA